MKNNKNTPNTPNTSIENVKVGKKYFYKRSSGKRFIVEPKKISEYEIKFFVHKDFDLGWYMEGRRSYFLIRKPSNDWKKGEFYSEKDYPEYFI